MAESQLDRIENMLKVILRALTTIELDGTEEEIIELYDKVKTYKKKKEGS